MGLTMDEGEIVAWRKREGDRVSAGEILFEVESDKATLEVEAPAAGFVRRILVNEGVTVPVTTVVALIADSVDEPLGSIGDVPAGSGDGEPILDIPAAAGPGEVEGGAGISPREWGGPAKPSHVESEGTGGGANPKARSGTPEATSPGPAASSEHARSSPAARKRAQVLGIDIATVPGTGPGGRVTLEDVEAAAAGKGRAAG
jgi:pyruvate dehydrogenase E2 component (dihydrolipoyllysine-residue acetyltransferase)